MDKKQDYLKESILIEYPDEDLFEDGELNNEKKWMTPISDIEAKIIKLWRQDEIVIAKWKGLEE